MILQLVLPSVRFITEMAIEGTVGGQTVVVADVEAVAATLVKHQIAAFTLENLALVMDALMLQQIGTRFEQLCAFFTLEVSHVRVFVLKIRTRNLRC